MLCAVLTTGGEGGRAVCVCANNYDQYEPIWNWLECHDKPVQGESFGGIKMTHSSINIGTLNIFHSTEMTHTHTSWSFLLMTNMMMLHK